MSRKYLWGLLMRNSAQIACYLHRVLRKALSGHKNPRAHAERSMSLDNTLYATFSTTDPPVARLGVHTCDPEARRCKQGHLREYAEIIGAKPGARIALPLVRMSSVSHNIRLVADEGEDRAGIHIVYPVKALGEGTGPENSIDWGVTEVCEDLAGVLHGLGLGKLLQSFTEKNNATGNTRGKLHARTRALRKVDQDPRKARRIARNNLGRNKQASRRTKAQASVRTLSGQAVKEVVYGAGNRTRARGKAPQDPSQRPRRLGLEDLSHLTGKAKSKKLSRICSTWMRSENQGRMVVHASIGGADAKTVNAAYMSQTCPEPTCGYVSRDNRQRDRFHCRIPYWDCNWQGDADHVAATNLLSRLADREIGVYTHYTEVKAILDERFQRRKESRVGARIVPWGTARKGGPYRDRNGDAREKSRDRPSSPSPTPIA
ncbi:MAG: zinc ribbon domain-containing protein [Acidimicrobiales bacterium]